jgi:transcriptional regulator GlxA family with amidase domain
MRSIDPTIEVRPEARFVDDGDLVTASGLPAGIDMALHVVSRLVSAERGRDVREGTTPRARRMADSGTMRPFQLVGVPYRSMAESGGIANAISVFRELDLAKRLAELGVEDVGGHGAQGSERSPRPVGPAERGGARPSG